MLWGEGLVLVIGAMMCLLAALWLQLYISMGNGWPRNALLHHWLMPISCHFWDCKALLVTSLTHVSVAIASVLTFINDLLMCVLRVLMIVCLMQDVCDKVSASLVCTKTLEFLVVLVADQVCHRYIKSVWNIVTWTDQLILFTFHFPCSYTCPYLFFCATMLLFTQL